MQFNPLVQLILCRLCLLLILLLQLCILLLVHLSLNQLVPTVWVNILLELMSLLSCSRFLYSRTISIRSSYRWFTCITLIISLSHFTTFLIPIHVSSITIVIDGKLKLWFGLCYSIVILFCMKTILWRYNILNILSLKYRHLNLFHRSPKGRSFTYYRFIYFIDLYFTKCFLIQASSQRYYNSFTLWPYQLIMEKLDNTCCVFGTLVG